MQKYEHTHIRDTLTQTIYRRCVVCIYNAHIDSHGFAAAESNGYAAVIFAELCKFLNLNYFIKSALLTLS